jgi:hypothetical protein
VGEETMDKYLERPVTRSVHIGRRRRASWLWRELTSEDLHFQDMHCDFELRRGTLLPPTRAARTPRSRGIFSEPSEPPKERSAWRRPNVSIVAVAVAVVAIASALVVGAPNAIMGAEVNLNPGPAMVGAVSVPPTFIAPSATR